MTDNGSSTLDLGPSSQSTINNVQSINVKEDWHPQSIWPWQHISNGYSRSPKISLLQFFFFFKNRMILNNFQETEKDTILLPISNIVWDQVDITMWQSVSLGLLLSVDYCGIRCSTLQWIAGFLSDRTQNVVWYSLSNIRGTSREVLGAILFLVYINDLALQSNTTQLDYLLMTVYYRKRLRQS